MRSIHAGAGWKVAAAVALLVIAVLSATGSEPLSGLLTVNGEPSAAQAGTTVLVPPTITQEPDGATDTSRAKFKLDHPVKKISFECSLDDSDFEPCHKNVQYQDLEPADHCFQAVAVDTAGNRSEPAESCWTNLDKATFGISGDTSGFYPGLSQPVDLRFANPHNQDIHVLSVEITVDRDTSSDCVGDENLVISREFTGPVTVPAKATMSLLELDVDEDQWPVLEMPNLDQNQDDCKNTDFTITYTGTASK